jgi:cytochrome d ubiquinol oxidase subunit II
MLTVVILFLWASILLYILLGGADFGAGILELLSPPGERTITRQLTFRAIGPIWEANHMWLVITVVILFVGFPSIYATVSTYLHIPLLILLLGIVARGTALSFRSNDAIKDDLQRVYSRVFIAASVITPFFLGIIAGSIVAGNIDPAANDFRNAYLYSWLRWFPLATGLFTQCICAWLASIYLIGRSDTEEDKRIFIHHTVIAHIVVLVSGILLFLAATADNVPLRAWISGNVVSLLAILAAVLGYILIWFMLLLRLTSIINIPAVFMVTMLFLSVTCGLFPNVVLLKNGVTLSLTALAGRQSITDLGWALLIGGLLIFPALFYLIYIFDGRTKETSL